MQENHLANESELQSYFMKRMEKFINSKGKKIIGWDEILEGGLAPNALVMSWRGEEGGIAAANQEHFAIMTPGNPLYFDHSQSINEDSLTQGGYNSIKSVYEYNPIPKELSAKASKFILGAQANMWTEYMDNEKKVEYMLFPRISALAELLWVDPQNKNWKNFESKIPSILKRYAFWNINFSKAFYDIEAKTLPNQDYKGLLWQLNSNEKEGNIFYKRPGGDKEIKYKNNIVIDTSGIWTAVLRNQFHDKISSPIHCFFHLNKATGKNIILKNQPNKNYAFGGAFALVDGIQNNAGMSKSANFLGFSGEDLSAVIDLGNVVNIDSIKLHAFEQEASWIYRPKYVEFSGSLDNISFYTIERINTLEGSGNLIYETKKNSKFRYIKIFTKNLEEIPTGMPGAGNKSWLFTDEIEIF
jgi:hexosaminidase